jgi:hypothetical protein
MISSHKPIVGQPMFWFSTFTWHWKGRGENDRHMGRRMQEREKTRREEEN